MRIMFGKTLEKAGRCDTEGEQRVKPYYSESGIEIYHADCREVLPSLPKVDLVLTDPPYGIGADEGVGGSGSKHCVRLWPIASWDACVPDGALIRLIIGIAPVVIIWGFGYMADMLGQTPAPMVWDKKCQNGWTDNFADVEIAWSKGLITPRAFRYQWMGACRGSNTQDGAKVHPTQKPLALMKWCLDFAPNALTVLDPFMGSGTTLRAAKDLGRKAIGIEIEEKYCEIAANRLRQGVLPLEVDTSATGDRDVTQGEFFAA